MSFIVVILLKYCYLWYDGFNFFNVFYILSMGGNGSLPPKIKFLSTYMEITIKT